MSKKKKKIKQFAMYRKYGEHSRGIYCSACCNCKKAYIENGRIVYKCIAYGSNDKPETNWSPHFTACGLINMPFNECEQLPLIGVAGVDPYHKDDIIKALKYKIERAKKIDDLYSVDKYKEMLNTIINYNPLNEE